MDTLFFLRTPIGTRLSNAFSQRCCVALALVLATTITGCSLPERTRALDDRRATGATLAVQVCSNCHGVKGVATSPHFPNLAAQSQPYLVEQLNSFKNHARSNEAGSAYMWGLSAHLSDEQINDLAAYFASQKPAQGKVHDEQLLKDGENIFVQGLPATNTPACSACHGAKAQGTDQFPRLAGQHADYVVKQLVVFQSGDQRTDGGVMKQIAHGLTRQNMESVAAYLEAIPAMP